MSEQEKPRRKHGLLDRLRRAEPLHHSHLYYVAGGGVGGRGRLAFAGMSLLAVGLVGTLGYWWLGQGRWSLFDCAYMVVITITTVGYAEILPISEAEHGRAFTMLMLIGGMGVSFYFLSSLTAFIIEGDLREALWRRRMLKRLHALTGHFIVCGAGRTGAYVADELVRAGCEVVVIERDPEHLEALTERHRDAIIAIDGDATDDGVLKEAGVDRARGLVTTLENDQDNLFVALSARGLNARLRIVSRADTERARPKLHQAGADAVISPTDIGGRRMAQELLRPSVVGFLDFMSGGVEQNLDIEEIEVDEHSPLVGKALKHSRIREVSSALVLAVIHGSKQTYNPPPDFTFEVGMTVIVLGEREQIERLNRYISGERVRLSGGELSGRIESTGE